MVITFFMADEESPVMSCKVQWYTELKGLNVDLGECIQISPNIISIIIFPAQFFL